MKGFLKFVGLCALISTTPVSGIDFSPSPYRFVIGDTSTLTMSCSLTETDIATRYNIIIKRETQPGSNIEEPLASFVKEDGNEIPKLHDGVTDDKDFQVTGSLSDSPPYIQVIMNIQKMICSDARVYKCEGLYETPNSVIKRPAVNASLQAFVLPVMTSPLEAKKNGDYVDGGYSSNKAQFNAGDQLELTCRANIGSRESTRIQWRKSSEIIDQNFSQYNPAANMLEESDALPDNQCGYTRTSTLKYNVTASDATYNLAFECYVEVTQYPSSTVTPAGHYEIKSARYYLDVDSDEPSSNEVASAVSGIDFSPSPYRFVIGDTSTLTMRCSLTETDISTLYNIIINRETQPGSNIEEPLASFVKEDGNEVPKLHDSVTDDKDFQVTGSLSDSLPYIQVTMNIQKMICSDARVYKCEGLYNTPNSVIKRPAVDASLQAFVLPVMTGPLEAKKNGDYVDGGDLSNKAQFNAGDQLELTCRANIGSRESTRIQWRKSSELIDNVFNQYNPAADMLTETDALNDNQCGYTKTSTLKYNVTTSDATYNLAFECYVEVTGYPASTVTPGGSYEIKSDRYYLDVDSDEPPSNEVVSAGSGNAGAIAGGVVGGLVLIVIVVLLVYFLWYRRRSSGEDLKRKHERNLLLSLHLGDYKRSTVTYCYKL